MRPDQAVGVAKYSADKNVITVIEQNRRRVYDNEDLLFNGKL